VIHSTPTAARPPAGAPTVHKGAPVTQPADPEPATRWLTPAERRAWLAYLTVTRLLEEALDRQLQRDSGMPLAYYQIIAMLSEAPGATLRMTDLAEITNSSPSRMSHAVARLEEAGWVRRERSPTDKRGNLAVLTEAGLAAVVAAAPGHVAAVRAHLFDALTSAQVDQLLAVCEAVLQQLDPQGLIRAARSPSRERDNPSASRPNG
jgi:DNA-binding MarR family transcriptional regulator